MDQDGFWALIEAAGEAAGWDAEGVADDLVCRLRELPVAELLAFDAIQQALMAESYRWDLWGAAELLNGGASDDGFEYFRAWLIAQGRAVYEAALRDPDSLAEHPAVRDRDPTVDAFESEDMLEVVGRAYELATAASAAPSLAGLRGPDYPAYPPSPMGERYDVGGPEAMRRRYPRLWALDCD